MCVRHFHPGKFALYSVLSFADLILTFFLLTHGKGHIYESNPIANAWLCSFGWSGLVAYKALTMALLAGTILFISLYQTRLAGRVLGVACVALLAVVGYSANIAYGLRAEEADLRSIEQQEKFGAFCRNELAPAIGRVKSKDWSLTEAADRLAASDSGYVQTLLHKRFPGLSDRECFTVFLKECIGSTNTSRISATRVSRRLARRMES